MEYWLARLGWGTPPPLSVEQLEMSSSRLAANGGRALGVTIGCLLGMFPLLFFKNAKDREREKADKAEKAEKAEKEKATLLLVTAE